MLRALQHPSYQGVHAPCTGALPLPAVAPGPQPCACPRVCWAAVVISRLQLLFLSFCTLGLRQGRVHRLLSRVQKCNFRLGEMGAERVSPHDCPVVSGSE